MVNYTCIDKLRDNNGKITAYRLIIAGASSDKNAKIVAPDLLKQKMLTHEVDVINLKLTSDNRLIDRSEQEWNELRKQQADARRKQLYQQFVDKRDNSMPAKIGKTYMNYLDKHFFGNMARNRSTIGFVPTPAYAAFGFGELTQYDYVLHVYTNDPKPLGQVICFKKSDKLGVIIVDIKTYFAAYIDNAHSMIAVQNYSSTLNSFEIKDDANNADLVTYNAKLVATRISQLQPEIEQIMISHGLLGLGYLKDGLSHVILYSAREDGPLHQAV